MALDVAVSESENETIEVTPVAGALGAEVRGFDLSQPLTDEAFGHLYRAFLDHLVVFFPDQHLTPAQHVAFSARFGEIVAPRFEPPFDVPRVEGFPEVYQLVKEPEDTAANIGGLWHADVTYRERPNLASIGYVLEAPAFGGDTLYANLYLAYETLSPGMQGLLAGLRAVHSSAMPHGGESVRTAALTRDHAPKRADVRFPIASVEKELTEIEHPVVRRHPDTGRRLLYVNRGFNARFAGMSDEESLPLLRYLWSHCERPEFTCRYRLRENTVVIWDNRCVLHYALNDYLGQRRVMHRISVNETSRPSA